MASPTAGSIVLTAFKKAGLVGDGQQMSGTQIDDGLTDFGDMLALWNEKRWLVWHLIDFAKISDGRQVPYSVGPLGDFGMIPAEPDRIGVRAATQHWQFSRRYAAECRSVL